jgi:hypothetical protein
VADVKLPKIHLTMELQGRKEIVSTENALQAGQGQMRSKGAIFRWKASLHQLCVERLLHVSQIAAHVLNTHPQDAWTGFVWKNPDLSKR